jgi:hypothetical protein
VFVFRGRRRRPIDSEAAAPSIDFKDESLLATDLVSSEWARAADEAARREDYRTAIRAAYLGTAATLASAGFLTIAPGKTNRDFERELRRRARRSSVVEPFSESMRMFERCWYGDYPAGADEFTAMRSHYDRITAQVAERGEYAA